MTPLAAFPGGLLPSLRDLAGDQPQRFDDSGWPIARVEERGLGDVFFLAGDPRDFGRDGAGTERPVGSVAQRALQRNSQPSNCSGGAAMRLPVVGVVALAVADWVESPGPAPLVRPGGAFLSAFLGFSALCSVWLFATTHNYYGHVFSLWYNRSARSGTLFYHGALQGSELMSNQLTDRQQNVYDMIRAADRQARLWAYRARDW